MFLVEEELALWTGSQFPIDKIVGYLSKNRRGKLSNNIYKKKKRKKRKRFLLVEIVSSGFESAECQD